MKEYNGRRNDYGIAVAGFALSCDGEAQIAYVRFCTDASWKRCVIVSKPMQAEFDQYLSKSVSGCVDMLLDCGRD